MKNWLLNHLVCPRDHRALTWGSDMLTCENGHSYPLVEGIPIMLLDDVEATHNAIAKTLSEIREQRVSEHDVHAAEGAIDPVVQTVIAATSGYLYRPLVGRLTRYPIPEIPIEKGQGGQLLDIGCNWGRWCVAAARKGYRAVGLDPDLGAVLAARRVAGTLGIDACFVVGDARFLPFRAESFDVVFSYSVLQHFSKPDARQTLKGVRRVLKAEGFAVIQMPNALGARSLYHQVRRRFREAHAFEVRYWLPGELVSAFREEIGPCELFVDGFFGLGIQAADVDLLPRRMRAVVYASELLRKVSVKVPPLKRLADSVYLRSTPA